MTTGLLHTRRASHQPAKQEVAIDARMKGTTVLFTGASGGMGRYAAVERGSEQYVRLAADPELANVSGMYFVSGQKKKEGSSLLSLGPALQKRIDDVAEAWAAPFLRARSEGLKR